LQNCRHPPFIADVNFTPRINGKALRAAARITQSKVTHRALFGLLRAELGIDLLGKLPERLRGGVPLHNRVWQGRPPREFTSADLPLPTAPWAPTSARIAHAFRTGSITPTELLERVLVAARAFEARRPSVGAFCNYADDGAGKEAAASTERWRLGRILGEMDGIPYAVKEETQVCGLPLRVGTSFLPNTPCTKDATIVDRIHGKGGIVVGLTSMTELGMAPTGVNSKRVMPHNPHAEGRMAGGSSTGSAVAVATGLVPFALGGDGGGSIRIPAALCGVFGIKPTWGRLSRAGDYFGGTVAHVGPIASSVLDLARVLEMASGHDPADSETFAAPALVPGQFTKALGRGVAGLRIGVDEREWACADPQVAKAGREALAELEKEGAELVPITLELAPHAASIGYVVIATEARAGIREHWLTQKDEMSDDLQITFAALDAIGGVEYLECTRLREGLRGEVQAAFRTVDLIALPTTKDVAPEVSDRDMETGILDPKSIDALCRFTFLGNLTGLPAASVPVGRDSRGLPMGLQLIGDAWDEATVLAAAAHLERIGAARLERPQASVQLLG
jgi:aspartyl-tRNA(Asn)/glutamyl-tRNA(Gln) amidotransferase subunit A